MLHSNSEKSRMMFYLFWRLEDRSWANLSYVSLRNILGMAYDRLAGSGLLHCGYDLFNRMPLLPHRQTRLLLVSLAANSQHLRLRFLGTLKGLPVSRLGTLRLFL